MSREHLAREAALKDAMPFGMIGMLNGMSGLFLGEADRERFNDGRVEYLDAWEPLLRLCDR